MESSSMECCSNCSKKRADCEVLKACGVCHAVSYCGADCQKAHWEEHKSTCTQVACQKLLSAIGANDVEQVTRLAKTKRVLNGKIDYSFNREGEVQTLDKWSALHECVRGGHTEMMKILLAHGPKVEIKDADGETPLFVASSGRKPELVPLLLKAGADPDAKAHDGWTCLMMAARDGDYESVKALLEGGADLQMGRDMFGRTALDIVKQMRTGQGVRMVDGETWEQAMAKYEKLYPLLARYA
jgi:ankyrin repeat protein